MSDSGVDRRGRVALVTGANHGIGAAVTRALASAGAQVVAAYYRLADPPDAALPAEYDAARTQTADRLVEEVRAAGGTAVAVEADLTDPACARALFDAAEAAFGPVDILVNNASGSRHDTFLAADVDRFGRQQQAVTTATVDRNFLVDARGAALLIAEYARRFIERDASWGRIVGLTSGGPMGFPGEVSYGAARAAQENYTMSAALELGPRGVTANVVYPPVTDTGWVTDDVRAFVATSPDHFHVARPEAVAPVIAWLCTDDAGLVNGNVIRLR